MTASFEASIGRLNEAKTLGWLIDRLLSVGALRPERVSSSGKAGPSFDRAAQVSSFATDSRIVGPGTVFVALKGERADGHDFLETVAAAGAVAALVWSGYFDGERTRLDEYSRRHGIFFLPVDDTLHALQEIARLHIGSFSDLIKVGVTGSNGKTTTKDLIAAILSLHWKCASSPGNQNSVIGLPLAALQVGAVHRVAVFEMAMSEKGEMARLAEIVLPDLGVITNIGLAHIGNIGSQLGIAYEKKQIFSRFSGRERAFLPAADVYLDELTEGLAGAYELYGESATPGYEGWEPWDEGQTILWKGYRIGLRLPGQHNRSNALAAIQVAVFLGCNDETIVRGLESFRPGFGRSEILRGPITIVQDCYNANPDSMKASISSFMEMNGRGGRRVMILGDMKELGADSAPLHVEIGEKAVTAGADTVLFYGPEMRVAYHAGLKALGSMSGLAAGGRERLLAYFENYDSLAAEAAAYVEEGDTVLLKASRSMALERLTPVLQAKFAIYERTKDV